MYGHNCIVITKDREIGKRKHVFNNTSSIEDAIETLVKYAALLENLEQDKISKK